MAPALAALAAQLVSTDTPFWHRVTCLPSLTHTPTHTAAFETPSGTTDEEEAYKPRPTKNPRKAHGDGKTPVLSSGLKGKKRAAEAAAAGGGGGEEEEEEEESGEGGSIIGPSILKGEAYHDGSSLLPGLSDKLGGLTAIAKLRQDAADVLAELNTKAESHEEGMVVPHDVFPKVRQVLNDAAQL